MPPGFPQGARRFTTAKVIVARAFTPAGATWTYAAPPFDPATRSTRTHVAGIAAGNAGTIAAGASGSPASRPGRTSATTRRSGPHRRGVGLDGNAPEIVAAIEAAVNDGMDVINLSLGEPEIEPARDVVARALDAAAAAGVVPVVAAGNDFDDFGYGSVTSPGNAESAITVAAVTSPSSGRPDLATFFRRARRRSRSVSSPTSPPPGSRSSPRCPQGGWEAMSGTSMANPQWPARSRCSCSATPRGPPRRSRQRSSRREAVYARRPVAAPPTRAAVACRPAAADTPLVLASPPPCRSGSSPTGGDRPATVALDDAGGGAGTGRRRSSRAAASEGDRHRGADGGRSRHACRRRAASRPAQPTGDLTGRSSAARGTTCGGPVLARRGDARARRGERRALAKPGMYARQHRGPAVLGSRYRYPDVPAGGGITAASAARSSCSASS